MTVARNLVLVSLCLAFAPALTAFAGAGPAPSPGLYVGGTTTAPLPVIETKVRGRVTGFVAEVTVTQTFVNPYDDFIEASYVFPLAERAAVVAMTMRLPDRDVVAEIKEREEAERVYDEAVRAGRTAALLSQERPNIFTQKVGNIPPGDVVDIELRYVEALPYEGGVSSFAFPTVVGPRYIPAAQRASAPSEVARITPPPLAAHESTPHRIDLELVLQPGLDIAALASSSHEIEVDQPYADEATVRIARGDNAPNKDFVLTIDLRGARPAMAVLAHREPGAPGFATLAIQPPALPEPSAVLPKDLFFVVDNSGSMHGAPIDAAKALVSTALAQMNPDDRFTIMRFSNEVSELSPSPLDNTDENVARGLAFIAAMEGTGGTEMIAGVRRALHGETPPGRLRIVFFLTDGYIGNDDEILAAVAEENQARARLFSLGVGSSVNRYLLSSMARLGRGEMQVMGHDEPIGPFVERFYRRVRNPVLSDVEVEWRGLAVTTPRVSLPDLFDAQPLLLHTRYAAAGEGEVVVRGRVAGAPYEHRVAVSLPPQADRPAIASLWAREQIARYDDEESVRPGSRRDEITELALEHSLMSRYTSFVAVDREVTRPRRAALIPVAQRLPLPEGVSRRALGSLSRREIPPGDPFIDIAAPADAIRVTAYFPFGLVEDLDYDPRRELWRARFLVPAGIDDGHYTVLLAIELADGSVLHRREPFHLDSEVAEFNLNYDFVRVRAGRGVTLEVDSVEPAQEVYVHAPDLGWDREPLASDDGAVDWQGFVRVPEDTPPGTYVAEVVVRDRAGNRYGRELEVEVYKGPRGYEGETCGH